MFKYLILGSSGQIGEPLTNYVRAKGHEVIEFDIENSLRHDLRLKDNEDLDRGMRSVDFVFFLAFDVGGAKYLSKYQKTIQFINNNLDIMQNTFSMLERYKKPFIFASSQMANREDSAYGNCKLLGEKYTAYLNGISVKPWNVYGPEHESEKSHVVVDFITMAKNSGTISMLTDGKEKRQMLHVDDCCECLYKLSKRYEELDRGRPYHITSFEWISVLDIAEEVASNFDNINIEPSYKKDFVQEVLNEPDRYITRYWQPKISLKDGIVDIINKIS